MDVLLLKIPDVNGDCQLKGYEKQIECLSYNEGVSAQITSDVSNTNRTSGKPSFQDMSITKYVDSSTPLLKQKCAEGANLGEVLLTIGRNDSGTVMDFLVYTLSDCVISTVSTGGGGGKPVESMSLNFSAIKYTYTAQKEAGQKEGQVEGSWDIATNAAS